MAQQNQNSSRAAALARRKAMSSGGKAAIGDQANRTRSAPATASTAAAPVAAAPAPVSSPAPAYRTPVAAGTATNPTRAAALARRKEMSGRGKTAARSQDRTRDQSMVPGSKVAGGTPATSQVDTAVVASAEPAPVVRDTPMPSGSVNRAALPKISVNPSKAAALARRKAQSVRGKAGISAGGMSQAQTARAANPDMSSRELAQALRNERSKSGKNGVTCNGSSDCSGKRRQRPAVETGAAEDAPWKVGASETSQGQTVTGTMVGRAGNMTGDEPSTCRAITGTEYLGADIFRNFCGAEQAASTARKVVVTTTSHGNRVSGNRVGRGETVTGNEAGTCKNVTGNEYISSEQQQGYCGTAAGKSPRRVSMVETMKGKSVTGNNVGRSEKVTGDEPGMTKNVTGDQYTSPENVGGAPAKVGMSATLRGGSVTGTMVGRRERMTGDEAGSCRDITGDDYIGQEQYGNFCGSQAQPTDQKVLQSATLNGMGVTGNIDGRSDRVTGNEPGTCKAVTGTPYAGAEDYAGFCEAPAANHAAARMQRDKRIAGMNMTGLQPGIGGVMTGAHKGACDPITGTPYVGTDQMAQACPSVPASAGSPDFPQAAGESGWGDFSVTPPSHAAAADKNTGITGSRYEQGHITGPFGMATGKVTGTEDARFGSGSVNSTSENEGAEPTLIDGRVKSRITGEGQDAGLRVTGDDWDRGSNITGTEGSSAHVRNPTLRGPMNAMAYKPIADVKNEAPQPASLVTGSSGNYEKGSLITYSGGARG